MNAHAFIDPIAHLPPRRIPLIRPQPTPVPELPEVETIRLGLARALAGARVRRVHVRRPDVITGDRSPRALLQGRTLAAPERLGKQLALFSAGGPGLSLHLGMSGRLLWVPQLSRSDPAREPRPPHTHLVWTLETAAGLAGELRFVDPRRFGGIWTHPSREHLHETRWSRLGPDAATIRAPQLRRALQGRRAPVKAVLLDQRALAGVGNIYADESLFHARIVPSRPAGSLTPEETTRLAGALRRVLRAAVRARGSTIRDYRTSEGQPGGFLNGSAVYGRAGRPCRDCSTALSVSTCAARTTVHCPACQR